MTLPWGKRCPLLSLRHEANSSRPPHARRLDAGSATQMRQGTPQERKRVWSRDASRDTLPLALAYLPVAPTLLPVATLSRPSGVTAFLHAPSVTRRGTVLWSTGLTPPPPPLLPGAVAIYRSHHQVAGGGLCLCLVSSYSTTLDVGVAVNGVPHVSVMLSLLSPMGFCQVDVSSDVNA